VKITPKALLSQNELPSLPQGVPTQLVPLVVELNDWPATSSGTTGVTLSQ
jgi:hypothetical protein